LIGIKLNDLDLCLEIVHMTFKQRSKLLIFVPIESISHMTSYRLSIVGLTFALGRTV